MYVIGDTLSISERRRLRQLLQELPDLVESADIDGNADALSVTGEV